VTETSSKGLLPQLTDMLYALTDSHELLLLKLQTVRLEHIGGGHLAIEESQRAQTLAIAEPRPPALVEMKVDATNDADRTSAIDEIEVSTEPTPIWFDSSSAVTTGSALSHSSTSAPSRSVTEAEVAIPSHDIIAATSIQTPIPTDPSVGHSGSPAAESADRNYNFFDELDLRLTSLANPESESGEN